MRPDIVEKLGNSTIQHGKYNDRIYLMKLAADDAQGLPGALKDLADDRGYSKIFAKVPAGCSQVFLKDGFQCEAKIPRLYHGREDALMLSTFLDEGRARTRTRKRNEEVMEACRGKGVQTSQLQLPQGAELREARSDDAVKMAELYRGVFPTYPFPIDDPAYIRETMADDVAYFGIWLDGKLIALSSADMDLAARHAEMTDFATLPDNREQGLATMLLKVMESDMSRRGITTAFTIARSASFGMNITFARMGYGFGGRLINNTNIGGRFEDMNVWHKRIDSAATFDESS